MEFDVTWRNLTEAGDRPCRHWYCIGRGPVLTVRTTYLGSEGRAFLSGFFFFSSQSLSFFRDSFSFLALSSCLD